MKSLPDSEIMQLATKPGPKQYRPFDDSELMQLATKPGPKQYLAFDELARRIRDNPSRWSQPERHLVWNALDITRAPNASAMEWALLKWSQRLNDDHHELKQKQDPRLVEIERHLGQEPESLASKYFNAIGAELHRQREKAAE